MSASEFAFLALGLVLGVASGAALVEVLRSRPPAPREVRVTVAHESLARRSSTLSHPAAPDAEGLAIEHGGTRPVSPQAIGSPTASGPGAAVAAPAPRAERRPAATAAPTRPALPPGIDAPRAFALGLAGPSRMGQRPADRTIVRPAAGPATVTAAPARPAVTLAHDAVGIPIQRAGGGEPTAAAEQADPVDREPPPPMAGGSFEASAEAPPGDDGSTAPSGPCADERRIADERCAIADRARDAARAAADALHAVQRAYDEHLARADAAEADSDPRAVRAAKEAAQAAFHAARAGASDQDGIEAAARDWLHEINAINTRLRDAQAVLERERDAVRHLVPTIERMALEADAARIGAESAEAACRDARDAVARCEEAAARAPEPTPEPVAAGPGDWPGAHGPTDSGGVEAEPAAAAAATAVAGASGRGGPEGLPVVIAMVRGDRAALERVISELDIDDGEERRQWRLRLAALVEAIVARAIEQSFVDFPAGHAFWGPFTREQSREIVGALAALGYRFDGLGGFVDERVPGHRELSLALGYAGIDPMRIRSWPTDAESGELYRDAVVAADEWLAGAAGELTLGEMIDALGRRADELAEVWNAWGRLRPILLADA